MKIHPYQPKIIQISFCLIWALIRTTSSHGQDAPKTPASEEKSTGELDKKDQTLVLSPFQVTSDYNSGYRALKTGSTSRVVQDYLDVPQTVNVITSEFINDYNIGNARELYLSIPNVAVSQSQYIQIRGVNSSITYTDGVAGGPNHTQVPYQFYDRIELVKGSSSAAFGLGEPAGIINNISKTPSGIDKSVLSVGFGNNSGRKFSFDTQGRVAGHNNISYRGVVFTDHQDSPLRNNDKNHGSGIHLALRDEINSTTSAQLIVSYSRTTSPVTTNNQFYFATDTGRAMLAVYGIPLPSNVSKNQELVPDGWANAETYDDLRVNLIFDKSFFDHRINAHSTTVYTDSNGYRTWGGLGGIYYNSNLDNPSIGKPGYYSALGRYRGKNDGHGFSQNLDVDSNLDMLGGKYRLSAGANFLMTTGRDYVDGPQSVNPDGSPWVQDIYHPNLAPVPIYTKDIVKPDGTKLEPTIFYWNHRNVTYQDGAYLNAEVKYWNFIGNVGVRKDFYYAGNWLYENDSYNHPKWQTGPIAPRYALTYKATSWLSVYALHAVHNDPTVSTQHYRLTTNNLSSVSAADLAKYENFTGLLYYTPAGTTNEQGVKATFLNNNIQVSFAHYTIDAGGSILPITFNINNPDGSTSQVYENKVTSEKAHGWEAEIVGQIGRRVQLIADYGITRGEFGNSTAEQRNYVDPPAVFSVHAKFDLGNLHGSGFYGTLGGTRMFSYMIHQNPTVICNAQNSFDAGLGYKWHKGKQSVALQVNNLQDNLNIAGSIQEFVSTPRRQGYLTYTLTF